MRADIHTSAGAQQKYRELIRFCAWGPGWLSNGCRLSHTCNMFAGAAEGCKLANSHGSSTQRPWFGHDATWDDAEAGQCMAKRSRCVSRPSAWILVQHDSHLRIEASLQAFACYCYRSCCTHSRRAVWTAIYAQRPCLCAPGYCIAAEAAYMLRNMEGITQARPPGS